MHNIRKYNLIFIFLYSLLFLLGIKTLLHGFPDIERFFAEWRDERIALTAIMKFGTLNFMPTIIKHPPLYSYLTFIPIAIFFVIGKLVGFFHDKIEFVRFYFNNTHYFFLIGRIMSYIFYWLSAVMIFRIVRLFYDKRVSHITTLSYLLIPRFIFDFSTTRPETLLFLNTSIFFYFFLKYYLNDKKIKYLLIAAFFLGVSIATKHNALFLGFIFIPTLVSCLRNEALCAKNYKGFLILCLKIGFLVFLGFFICDPFFIIQFKKYFYNLYMHSVEAKYYWKGHPVIFLLTHIKNLNSVLYLNFLGFFILLFGAWSLFKKDKKLFIFIFFTILVFEIYFGIHFRNYSPLYYLNPLVPIAGFIFGSGVNYIINHKKKFVPILIIFGTVLLYNYIDIWQGLSFGPTYLQKARAFIEKTIPEFTTICIASNNYLPQLNMTEESYHHLINTATVIKDIEGHELTYKDMDNEERYDDIFRQIRVESLMKNPQYNLIRWDENIKTVEDAISFLKTNNIKYIISNGEHTVDDKNLEDTKIASLEREFKPRNRRIYETVYGGVSLFLYKVGDARHEN